jgi:hypothetical protein
MTSKRIFPIKQDPACLLKWGWSSIYFTHGTTSSCHRTKKFTIDPNNFENFHNLPEKIKDREMMLDGKWCGNGCEYCRDIEQKNQISDRIMQLDMQQDPGLTAPELHIDPTATHVTPTIIEAWFSNTCNMKCIYCGPEYSSLWVDEIRKHGTTYVHPPIPITKDTNPHREKMIADFWKYLETDNRYRALRRYHVLGGEPFLIEGTDQSLDFWDQHPNPDLVFAVISNFNIPHARFLKYVDRFQRLVDENKVWQFQLTASIDSWGPHQEFVRYGLDLDLLQKNFESLLGRPWASLSVNSTISSLTIKQMPELMEKINQWSSQHHEPILHSFNYSMNHDNPFMFGRGVFDEDFEKILALMPEDTEIQRSQKSMMNGIAESLKNTDINLEKIKRYKQYLDLLDQRRGTNWRALFSWLDKDFSV